MLPPPPPPGPHTSTHSVLPHLLTSRSGFDGKYIRFHRDIWFNRSFAIFPTVEFTRFLAHDTEQSIALNYGLNEPSGLVERYIRENSRAKKRVTTQCNTAELTQPKPNMAASMPQDIAREQRCEQYIIILPIGLTRWMWPSVVELYLPCTHSHARVLVISQAIQAPGVMPLAILWRET